MLALLCLQVQGLSYWYQRSRVFSSFFSSLAELHAGQYIEEACEAVMSPVVPFVMRVPTSQNMMK